MHVFFYCFFFSEPESFDAMWANWAPWAAWDADTSTRGEGVKSRDRTVMEQSNGKESQRLKEFICLKFFFLRRERARKVRRKTTKTKYLNVLRVRIR